MKAVAFFDVDGTLVPGISSAVHLAGYLGQAEADTTLQAVLFDLDGTLVDQESAAAAAVVEWAAEHGITDSAVADRMLPAGKPDPRAFLQTVDRLGLTATDVLMVGDSLEKDVHGALAVGIDAVLVDRYDAHADAGVRRIRSLQELSGVSLPVRGL